jgi:preprotein translocase subunit SecG
MVILLTIVHVIVCFFLIIVVLLQSGKAADLAGAFGGMGSQTAFGPRGAATVLSKATTIAAALFMVTSLSLSVLASRNSGSVSPDSPFSPAREESERGASQRHNHARGVARSHRADSTGSAKTAGEVRAARPSRRQERRAQEEVEFCEFAEMAELADALA